MDEVLWTRKENTAARCNASGEDFDAAGHAKDRQAGGFRKLMKNQISQSSELVLFHPGRRRAKLTVHTPRHFTLPAGTNNSGAQTIHSKQDML